MVDDEQTHQHQLDMQPTHRKIRRHRTSMAMPNATVAQAPIS